MIPNFFKFGLVALMLTFCSCAIEPVYDGGPPPAYDYGYGSDYPWATGASIDIIGGYGHGGYGHGGGYGRGGGGRSGRGSVSRR
jgi:hypothetical protein